MTSRVTWSQCVSSAVVLFEVDLTFEGEPNPDSEERMVSSVPMAPMAPLEDLASRSEIIWPFQSGSRKTVFIRDLHDARVALAAPIPVLVETSEGQVTACCYDLEQFGAGEDEFAALDDLRATIVELYFVLKGESRLGPLPQRQLAYLKRALREV